MEYVPSRSLGHLIAERRALSPADVAAVGAGVAVANDAGIMHRDAVTHRMALHPALAARS